MLETLTLADFQDLVGKTFRLVRADASPLDLVLTEARSLARADGAVGPRRAPFSLLFLGPVQPVLPQRIYPLEIEALGRLEIFLGPVGADAQGVQYEAVFN